jgi:Skp family chaperone for outer membrane proteins
MRSTAKRINWPAGILIVSLAAVIGYQAWAARPAPPAAPATVAIVDLEELFEGLKDLDVGRAQLEEHGRALEAEAQRLKDEIAMLQDDLDLYPQGSEKYQETDQRVLEKSFELKGFLRFAEAKMDVKQAELLRDLYAKIKEEVARYAVQYDIDIVLMDDSRELRDVPNRDEMMRQISARRMLYGSDRLDITKDLIEFINAP